MEKKYNLIHQFRLETYVNVNGEMIPVSFASGSIKGHNRINGHFITSDPKLQEALENDRGYGSQWTLDKNTLYKMQELEGGNEANVSNPIVDPVVDPVIEPTTPASNPPADPPAPADDPVTGDPKLAEIVNYTHAKNYILSLYPNTTRAEIISADKLRAFAESKGIKFPNWAE